MRSQTPAQAKALQDSYAAGRRQWNDANSVATLGSPAEYPLPDAHAPLRFTPPPLRPAWLRVAALVFCIVVWTAVYLMVFG